VTNPIHEVSPIEIDKDISHRPDNLETLFENKVVAVRNLKERSIFKIRSELNRYIRQFLHEQDFTEIQTPKLLAGATEGGAEVFKVSYFEREAVLAQSPQFYKQIMAGSFERVFEIGPTFRAEPSMTSRHMSEITMLDIEMGFVKDHQEVLDMIAGMVSHTLKETYALHAADLKSLQAPELKLTEVVPVYTIAQIHEMYTKATKTNTIGEKDLIPDEERWIAEYARREHGSDLVYAAAFPKVAGKFYHKFRDDGTVAWADLLFRGLEIATCPLRENNYEKMIQQMSDAGLEVTHPGYKYYLQAFKYGLPQHGGCGLGVDRLVQKTIGLANVKEATLFPRDMNRLTP
jgi:nondiscriminating aspartyl-tRNA synthetase